MLPVERVGRFAHKRAMLRRLPVLALAATIAACVPRAAPPPRPAPAPTPAPSPTPAPLAGDWRDLPVTPGDWTYRRDGQGSVAAFGLPGRDPELTIRCDRSAGRILLSRRGAASANMPMTIRTSSTTRALAVPPGGSTSSSTIVALAPEDRILDAMGFSRGRFVVEMPPMPTLVVPAWAEVLRVTEDCRQ